MKQILKTPVKILINGKFLCIAQEVEMYSKDPSKRGVMPHDWTGQVIDIKKDLPRARKEREAAAKAASKSSYDEFFKQAQRAVGDPKIHIPVDIESL